MRKAPRESFSVAKDDDKRRQRRYGPRNMKVKRRRIGWREAMLFVVALAEIFPLYSEAFLSSRQKYRRQRLMQQSSYYSWTTRYATVENENKQEVSTKFDERDQHWSQNPDGGDSSSDLWNGQELFFARKVTAPINYEERKGIAKANGISPPANGVKAQEDVSLLANNRPDARKNGIYKENGAVNGVSSQPSVIRFYAEEEGENGDKNELEDIIQRAPNFLRIIDEMNMSGMKVNTTVPSLEASPGSPPEETKGGSKSYYSMLSTVSSIVGSAVSKVGNTWRRVSPFGSLWTSGEWNNAETAIKETTEAIANKTIEDSPPSKKKLTKEEAVMARMSRKKKKQLSNLLNQINKRTTKNLGGITARTLTGLISALAEEADDLGVQVHAEENTPFWRKQIDSLTIEFTRLGFKPLHMGGPDQLIRVDDVDRKLHKERSLIIKQQQEQLKQELESQRVNKRIVEEMEEDECPVDYDTDEDGNTIATMSCADTAFQRIDVDNSGALDKNEIADALVMAASSMEAKQDSGGNFSGAVAEIGAGSRRVIQSLAKQLVDLYDTNDDGVIDRSEYQHMVEDMAALRQVQKEREHKREEKLRQEGEAKGNNLWNSIVGAIFRGNSTDEEEQLDEMLIQKLNGESARGISNTTMKDELLNVAGLSEDIPQTLGKIEFENLKMDMRQLFFGAIPFIRHIIPGGPLFLEPFTVTIVGSFTAEDLMKSSLLDAGLRQLVSFALRRRVRSFRDVIDGAMFHGRKWKRGSAKAPLVECTELTSVEVDDQDRLIITGRAKVRASEDAPVIDNSFKLRTRVANPRNGRAIKLSDPEIAIVLECPPSWEKNINGTFNRLGMKLPSKPQPIYTYIPMQSPFNKDDDKGGYYMGEDNRIKSICVKDKCLRFELEAVLRPGRFLGNHYLAFTVPQRALIITVDRVKNGIRAARRRKKALQALQKTRHNALEEKAHHAEDALAIGGFDNFASPDNYVNQPMDMTATEGPATDDKEKADKAPARGFISRFVDGYLQAGVIDENEKLTVAISDWFGRQGSTDADGNSASGIESPSVQDGVTSVIEEIALGHMTDEEPTTPH